MVVVVSGLHRRLEPRLRQRFSLLVLLCRLPQSNLLQLLSSRSYGSLGLGIHRFSFVGSHELELLRQLQGDH